MAKEQQAKCTVRIRLGRHVVAGKAVSWPAIVIFEFAQVSTIAGQTSLDGRLGFGVFTAKNAKANGYQPKRNLGFG